MNPQLLVSGIFLLLFLGIVLASQLMYKASVSTEKSRKFVHVAGGTLALFLPLFIESHEYVLGICSLAFLLLLVSRILKGLPGIHRTKRKSVGSIIFPIPIYICFAAATDANDDMLFYIPVSLMTYSDTVAEWGGKKLGKYGRAIFGGRKTVMGSLCFFASALVIISAWPVDCGGINFYVSMNNFTVPLKIALATTIVELISLNGWDNLTVPLAALGLLL